MTLVVGMFKQYENAERAVDALLANRFDMNEISAIVSERVVHQHRADTTNTGREGTAGVPAVLGLGGVLAGLKGTVLPGVGTVMTSGPLLSELGTGAAEANAQKDPDRLAVALADHGISPSDAAAFAEGLKQGAVLLAVDSADRPSDARSAMLQNNGDVKTGS